MKICVFFQAFWYEYYDGIIKNIEAMFAELTVYMSEKVFTIDMALDRIDFSFINTENLKCRIRPNYRALHVTTKEPDKYLSLMALLFEIPLPQSDFIKVCEKDMPTYIGKALLKVLETQNVPVKIRKQFDRERFISDVRDFFVNVKGCQL